MDATVETVGGKLCMWEGKTLANPPQYILPVTVECHVVYVWKEGWTHCVYLNPRPPSKQTVRSLTYGHCVFWNTFLGKFQLFCSFYKGSRKILCFPCDGNFSTAVGFSHKHRNMCMFFIYFSRVFPTFLFSNLTFGANLTFLLFLMFARKFNF